MFDEGHPFRENYDKKSTPKIDEEGKNTYRFVQRDVFTRKKYIRAQPFFCEHIFDNIYTCAIDWSLRGNNISILRHAAPIKAFFDSNNESL
jgi:hypothetical protein